MYLPLDFAASSARAFLDDEHQMIIGTGVRPLVVERDMSGHREQDPEQWSLALALMTSCMPRSAPGPTKG